MSVYTVTLQTHATFTATVTAADEDDAYEKAQDLAAELAAQHHETRSETGQVVLSIDRDDINNPRHDDIQEVRPDA